MLHPSFSSSLRRSHAKNLRDLRDSALDRLACRWTLADRVRILAARTALPRRSAGRIWQTLHDELARWQAPHQSTTSLIESVR